MSNEWDANIQAIGHLFDRDRAEIAELREQLAAKDNRIAVLDHLLKEVSDNLDASEKELREAQETVKRLQQNFGCPA